MTSYLICFFILSILSSCCSVNFLFIDLKYDKQVFSSRFVPFNWSVFNQVDRSARTAVPVMVDQTCPTKNVDLCGSACMTWNYIRAYGFRHFKTWFWSLQLLQDVAACESSQRLNWIRQDTCLTTLTMWILTAAGRGDVKTRTTIRVPLFIIGSPIRFCQ